MMGFARKLMAETDKIMDDMKKKDKEDSEKVEAAVRFAQEKKEKVAAQKSEAETKSRLTAMVKSTAIRELVKVGIRKGLVPSSELQSKIAELSKLSDVEFEATKKVWASLPDAMSTPKGSYVPRNVREASRPAGAGLSLTDGSTQKLGGSLEDGTLFGTDHL
jgi:vacuolar-type H+-ATPase subunit I/STV1